jgi:hypothetical protein
MSITEVRFPQGINIPSAESPEAVETFITISFDLFLRLITPLLSAADLVNAHTTNRFFNPLLDRSIVAKLHLNYSVFEFGYARAKVVSLLTRIGTLLTRVNLEGIDPINESFMALLPNLRHLTIPTSVSLNGISGTLSYTSISVTKVYRSSLSIISAIMAGQLKNVENLFLLGDWHAGISEEMAVAIQGGCLAGVRHLRVEGLHVFCESPWKLIQASPQLEKLELSKVGIKGRAGDNIDEQLLLLSVEAFGLNPDRDLKTQLDRLPVWELKVINLYGNSLGDSGTLLLLRMRRWNEPLSA